MQNIVQSQYRFIGIKAKI